MKTHLLSLALAGMVLAATNSYAQDAENSNPYAIFGCTPYVAGDKDAGADTEKVFVIENPSSESQIARMEHNPKTGEIRLFDLNGVLIAERLLTRNEKAWPTIDRKAEKYYSISPYAFCAGNPIRYIDPNGEEIWIYYQDDDGNEQKMLYTANMEYKGSNSFVGNMVSNLNAVYTNGGNAMLDVLISSRMPLMFSIKIQVSMVQVVHSEEIWMVADLYSPEKLVARLTLELLKQQHMSSFMVFNMKWGKEADRYSTKSKHMFSDMVLLWVMLMQPMIMEEP